MLFNVNVHFANIISILRIQGQFLIFRLIYLITSSIILPFVKRNIFYYLIYQFILILLLY